MQGDDAATRKSLVFRLLQGMMIAYSHASIFVAAADIIFI